MIYEVELWGFGSLGKIRQVDVPYELYSDCKGNVEEELELVFKYGQNDFQPLPIRSVSVDDVVRINVGGNTQLWKVAGCGFEQLLSHTFYHNHIQSMIRQYKTLKGVA